MSYHNLVVFPDLTPRSFDALWFDTDRPVDLNAELKELETEQHDHLQAIRLAGAEILPLGKASHDPVDSEDNQDDYEDDDNDDDEEHSDEESDVNEEFSETLE